MAILLRVRTVFTGVPGTPWYSNLYFDDVAGSPDPHIDLVRDFWTAFQAVMKSNTTATIEGDCAQIEDSTGAVVGIRSGTALTVVGASASAPLPPANQCVLHEFTSLFVGGRQLRGKTFVPGIIATQSDALGAPLAGLKTIALGAGNALITASNPIGNWKVWSKKNGVSSDVTAVSTPSKFGVLRSRRD